MEAHVGVHADAPEDAEFYVVVQGSRLTHITTAKREDDGLTLCFTVPGMLISNLTHISLFCCLCLCLTASYVVQPHLS